MLIKEIADFVRTPIEAGAPLGIKLMTLLSASVVYVTLIRWWGGLFLRCLAYEEGTHEKEAEDVSVQKKGWGKIEVFEKPYTEISNKEDVPNAGQDLFCQLICCN